jgi:hypothetical protein
MLRCLALTSLCIVLTTACGGSTESLGSPAADSGADSPVPDPMASDTDAAAAVQAIDCVPDGAVMQPDPGDPGVQQTLSGTNGVFVDTCDAQGNLVQYSCETATTCGPGVNPGCSESTTGRVDSQNVNCSGHCAGGRCDSRCPDIGQRFHFVAVGPPGTANLANDSDGRTYACSVSFDQPSDAFDCSNGPAPGMTGAITSLGLHGTYCPGEDFGNVGVSIDGASSPATENCAYACGIL